VTSLSEISKPKTKKRFLICILRLAESVEGLKRLRQGLANQMVEITFSIAKDRLLNHPKFFGKRLLIHLKLRF